MDVVEDERMWIFGDGRGDIGERERERGGWL